VKLSGPAFFAAGYLAARGARQRRRAGPRQSTATLTGVPDHARRPQEGIVAEAAIVARLLRLRILTLDATVLFSPARVTTPTRERPAAAGFPRAAAGRAAWARPTPVGRGLADARRTLDEGTELLADARLIGEHMDGAAPARANRRA
jgi:hypothetical protein